MTEEELKSRLAVIESQRAEASKQKDAADLEQGDDLAIQMRRAMWQGQVDMGDTIASVFPEYMTS